MQIVDERARTIDREQHAYVHLVRFGLEPLEKIAHAVPRPRPRFFPVHPTRYSFEHPRLLRRCELAPRFFEGKTAFPAVCLDVVLTFAKARCLPWPDCTVAQ